MGTESLLIDGGHRLSGRVPIEGAKNAALPACVASLLTDERIILHRIPQLRDVSTILFTLTDLGKRVVRRGTSVIMSGDRPLSQEANAYSVRQMRASFLVLGPLIARLGRAVVPLPGGCAIGERAVDLHLSALQKMGASVEVRGQVARVEAERLRGARIDLAFPSVGATEQILMAATLANGETQIANAAVEPEVMDLVALLRKMGAEIEHAGRRFRVTGTDRLRGAEHSVISDRMEAGTYLLAGAMAGGEVAIDGVNPEHLAPFLGVLEEAGINVRAEAGSLFVSGDGECRGVRVETGPHPAFPTDLHPPLAALLTLADGTSSVKETVFERRHTYADGLRTMGAQIAIHGSDVTISGVRGLRGHSLVAPDIRSGAALVLAAVAARGESEVAGLETIDRGYAALEAKLRGLGARIERRTR